MDQLAQWRGFHVLVVAIDRRLASSAANSLSDIDASFGSIAGLARIDSVLGNDVGRTARVAAQPLRIRAIAGAVAVMVSTRFRRGSIAFFARSIAR